MEEVTLMCALLRKGGVDVFPVVIDKSKVVGLLQDAIKAKNPATIKCDAKDLRLFLAKKGDAWLPDEDSLNVVLQGRDFSSYLAMRPSWKLAKPSLFGPNVSLGEDVIHVLVVTPEGVSGAEVYDRKKRKVEENEAILPPPTESFEPFPPPAIHNDNYVTMSAALLDKCGLVNLNADKVMMYCRREVRNLWHFLQEEVIQKNARGCIVGPPGTGKSLSTLCFVAQLDPNEWNVVWIHFGLWRESCLSIGRREYWDHVNKSTFVVPRVAGKRLFVCLDGYKSDPTHLEFLKNIRGGLTSKERLLVCSSMATLGKLNQEDAKLEQIRVFSMYSWTLADYETAVADGVFYKYVVSKMDATQANEVNDDGDEEEPSEAEKKKHALDCKFYYAGGSCRFMFLYTTDEVKQRLQNAVDSIANKNDLILYCSGSWHRDTINTLYGKADGGGGLFPVSSYAASLFAKESGADIITLLASRLNTSKNPAMDGHLMEWLFLASVPKRAVELVGDNGVIDELPMAPVFSFDPKKRFGVRNGRIKGNKSWLQPVAWNQGGYDAVYFDEDNGNVIFIQVTRSDTHSFKMRFFFEVLLKLQMANMEIKTVEVYFVVKSAQYLNFKINHIDDRDLLCNFDARWKQPEEKHVKSV
ncbi:hypothetical protein PF007_g24775 [Phytophthora fragariae]|uniref:Crinkler effector protein N-terminal domain-containing protein n=2 Tax=Phytophthora fragariae TaxID=53985 RepID=A0A6A3QGX0_9STRA|nr:hypothetical protein PF007_g24775 [Phytophthora fragariae]